MAMAVAIPRRANRVPESNLCHCVLRAFGHLLFCVLQRFRGVNVLPPGAAYIDRADLVISSHNPNSISQTAITLATAGLRALEIIKYFRGTNEQAGINRIVVP